MIKDFDLLYQCVNDHRFIVKESDKRDGMSCIECGAYAAPLGYAKNFQTDELRTKMSPSKLEIKVRVTDTELFQQMAQLLKDVTKDERVPAAVRKEINKKIDSFFKDDAESCQREVKRTGSVASWATSDYVYKE